MNEQSQLNASMWLMITVQTIGAIDNPGHGHPGVGRDGKAAQVTRKMPAPKTYVAVAVLWSIFGLITDAGQGKAAVAMAWITTLTAMVIGPFGSVGTKFLKTIADNFYTAPQQQGATTQGATLA